MAQLPGTLSASIAVLINILAVDYYTKRAKARISKHFATLLRGTRYEHKRIQTKAT